MTDVLNDLTATAVLPLTDESQRVDLPEPVFAPWLGRVRDETASAKHRVKRGQR